VSTRGVVEQDKDRSTSRVCILVEGSPMTTGRRLKEMSMELKIIINFLNASREVPEDHEQAMAEDGLFSAALSRLRSVQKQLEIEAEQLV